MFTSLLKMEASNSLCKTSSPDRKRSVLTKPTRLLMDPQSQDDWPLSAVSTHMKCFSSPSLYQDQKMDSQGRLLSQTILISQKELEFNFFMFRLMIASTLSTF